MMEKELDEIAEEFKSDPRNKVFASQDLLLKSVFEETGRNITAEDLSRVIQDIENGDMNTGAEEVYDALTYCCGVLAKKCFSNNPEDEDEEVDFEVTFLEGNSGIISAEIRPN
jgi:hypothetical protein